MAPAKTIKELRAEYNREAEAKRKALNKVAAEKKKETRQPKQSKKDGTPSKRKQEQGSETQTKRKKKKAEDTQVYRAFEATVPKIPFADLQRQLMPFQKEGVRFALSKQGRCLIGDEMGLGKTIQAIAIAAHYAEEWPLLVVAPSSMRYTWACEIEKWLPTIPAEKISVVRGRADCDHLKSAWVSIVSYSLFTASSLVATELSSLPFKVVIADESHYLKNRKAIRTTLLSPILQRAERVIMLSGTPALARPVELYPQVSALRPDLFGKFTPYALQFCNAQRKHFGWDYSGSSNLPLLHEKLREVMVRRRKEEVLDQLPAKRRQRLVIDVAGSAVKELKQIAEQLKFLRQNPDLMEEDKFGHDRLIMDAYIKTGNAKAKGVSDYLDCLFADSGPMKLLIFGHHHFMLDTIEQSCVRGKVGYVRIDGKTQPSQRHENVVKFQKEPSIQVAILGLTSAGQGLTLTAASTVIFTELHWTPGVLNQAEDRAHRIGQKNAVNVIYLVSKGQDTFDEIMWNMLVRKTGIVTRALNGAREHLKGDFSSASDIARETSKGKKPSPRASSTSSSSAVAESKVMDGTFFPKGDLRAFFSQKGTAGSADERGLEAKEQTKRTPLKTLRSKETERLEVDLGNGQPIDLSASDAGNQAQGVTKKGSDDRKEGDLITPARHQPESRAFISPPLSKPRPLVLSPIEPRQKSQTALRQGERAGTPPPTAKEKKKISWECPVCTLINEKDGDENDSPCVCSICETRYFPPFSSSNQRKKDCVGPRSAPESCSPQVTIELTEEDSLDGAPLSTTTPHISSSLSRDSAAVSAGVSLKEPREALGTGRKDQAVVVKRQSSGADFVSERETNAGKAEIDPSLRLYFSVSANTGRISIYDCDQQPLNLNFEPTHLREKEWVKVPSLLRPHHPANMRQAIDFVREWDELRSTERKVLSNRVLLSPFAASRELEMEVRERQGSSFQRYSKSITQLQREAGNLEKTERASSLLSSSSSSSGISPSLCLVCNKELVQHPDTLSLDKGIEEERTERSSSPSFSTSFCSFSCREQYQVRTNSQAIRSQLFRLERGVCQKCGEDAHSFFQKFKQLEPPERLNLILSSRFRLPQKRGGGRERMLLAPVEGDFWQADHIVPVSLGGGECSLHNLRTLCTPCHEEETEKLRERRRHMGAATLSSGERGGGDIRKWIRTPSAGTL